MAMIIASTKCQGEKTKSSVWLETMGKGIVLGEEGKEVITGAFLVVQWLGICLPMQGTWIRALGQKVPTCHGASKPMHHNY